MTDIEETQILHWDKHFETKLHLKKNKHEFVGALVPLRIFAFKSLRSLKMYSR